MRDEFVLLERKVIDPSNAVTMMKFGKTVILLHSAFGGKRQYNDILGGIVERRIKQASAEEHWAGEPVEEHC